jgi:P-type Ca2+ transporter type 2C
MTLEKFTPRLITTKTDRDHWHALGSEEVLALLETRPETGLTAEEATKRLETYGPNQLTEAPSTTIWQMLIQQINSFVIILLIVASIISMILGDYIEASAIMAIVVLNAVLGVIQERRADQALAALRKMAAPEALVIRDGSRQLIPASHLVLGDLVLLEAGNYIPADLRLIEAINLQVEEAALTGESMPVQKDAAARLEKEVPLGDRRNTTFMGTVVTYGRGKGVVVGTGMHTQIGMIAEMLQGVEQEQTPLQRRLDQLGKSLGLACVAVSALVFIFGWLRGYNPLDIFLIAVSLAIAAVPEGLPAVVAISLALGMREMIKHHALIRRLSSVETLGSATTICSDKTGTITQNEMTATHLWVDGQFISISGQGYDPVGEFQIDEKPVDLSNYQAALTVLWVSILNNNAVLEISGIKEENKTYRMVGDPTEGALIVAAVKAGASPDELNEAYPRIQEIPFDADRKRMVTVHSLVNPQPEDISPFDEAANKPQGYAVTVKGAPDMVLNLCKYYQRMDDQPVPLDEAQRMRILNAIDLMSQDALRVLGLAYRLTPELPQEITKTNLEQDLIFAGLIGMIDPPRPEVIQALAIARQAGIRTMMITGDYANTARAIAERIGLLIPGHQVLSGSDLDAMSDETLQREVIRTDVFARVSPEHKLRVVEALQKNGEIVAMTGDGANDAPSLKRADIGVAMGIAGTDVTKESADMVLTDDNYASIVSAVKQGRIIYSNIRKFVYYLLSCNLAEIAIILLGTLFTQGSPLSALQILWLNLITDGAPALALGTEKGDPDIMQRPPRPPSEPIVNRSMLAGISLQTIAITIVTLGAYLMGLRFYTNPEIARTMAFVTLSTSELVRAFTARSEHYPLFKIGIFTNPTMNLGTLLSLALLLAVVYLPFVNQVFKTIPLTWTEWRLLFPLIFIPAITAEVTKWVQSRLRARA